MEPPVNRNFHIQQDGYFFKATNHNQDTSVQIQRESKHEREGSFHCIGLLTHRSGYFAKTWKVEYSSPSNPPERELIHRFLNLTQDQKDQLWYSASAHALAPVRQHPFLRDFATACCCCPRAGIKFVELIQSMLTLPMNIEEHLTEAERSPEAGRILHRL